jgi:opacity protein-like surface antigen
MDKNLISIDDLVRQRLGGGEEQEQAGSWMRMKDLLDKEMPQRPAGMYGRRIFSAIAILLLIAAIGLGGSQLNYFKSIINGAGNNAAVAITATHQTGTSVKADQPPVKAGQSVKAQEQKDIAASGGQLTSENEPRKTNDISSPVSEKKEAKHHLIAARSTDATAHHLTLKGNGSNTENGKNDVATSRLGKQSPSPENKDAKNTAIANNIATAKRHATGVKEDKSGIASVANSIGSSDVKESEIKEKTNSSDKTIAQKVSPQDKSLAVKDISKVPSGKALTANTEGKDGNATPGQKKELKVATAGKSGKNNIADRPYTPKTEDANSHVFAGNISSVSGKSKHITAPKPSHNNLATKQTVAKIEKSEMPESAEKEVNSDKMPVAANMKTATAKKISHKEGIAAKKIKAAGKGTPRSENNVGENKLEEKPVAENSSPATTDNNKTPIAAKSGIAKQSKKKTTGNIYGSGLPAETGNKENTAVAEKLVSKPVTAKKSGKKIAGITQPNPVLSSGSGSSSKKTTMAKVSPRSQKQVERLIVSEHFIKTSAREGYYKMDTISSETITLETGEDVISFPPLLPFGPPPYDPQSLGIAASKSSHTTTDTKEMVHAKKRSGSTSLESLHAAFNDVKSKFTGAHFAPGLTAGINGTFFGPNSFKGFQFGVNGNFILNDQVSVMADLKYFHRINNDYTLNDNYYTYTPVATGGYSKELIVNPYNFSTLHSIEMPLYVRYTSGNFNFFVGGNFLYMFSINTGAYPLANPGSITQVSAIENDNKPQLQAKDFDSRFGMGYLVGASYQVTSKVTIDFREVQTLWDNGSSSGSKIISNQLYRSPSLQLSLGYTLGGNKERNKE